jgi:class 3 adenylate cyclase/tetratricopeptide (TPR) repeat protein
MELLADRDPEEARAILDPVLERMMAAVHRYEGTVNQVMGDGIMALFGAPIAHEDHAVRACYAALAMQTSVKEYATEVRRTKGVPIQIRVGLNAGEVVVRSIGSDLHMDYTAVGQTTHLAARMEQMAMPGSILITPAVFRLAEGHIQVTSLGPVPVKGLTASVEVSEVTGAGYIRTRLQAAAYSMGGRVADAIALLTQALEQITAMTRTHFETLCGLPLGEAYRLDGRIAEAHAPGERALVLARAHQERGHQAYALCLLSDIAAQRNPPEVELVEASYQQALALAEELGMRPLQAHCHLGLGTLYAKLGRPEPARAECSIAIELYKAMAMMFKLPEAECWRRWRGGDGLSCHPSPGRGAPAAGRAPLLSRPQRPLVADLLSVPIPEGRYPPVAPSPLQQRQQTLDALVAWLLAEAFGGMGQITEGLSVVEEALAAIHHLGERYYEAELYRLKGELLRQQAVPDERRRKPSSVRPSTSPVSSRPSRWSCWPP